LLDGLYWAVLSPGDVDAGNNPNKTKSAIPELEMHVLLASVPATLVQRLHDVERIPDQAAMA